MTSNGGRIFEIFYYSRAESESLVYVKKKKDLSQVLCHFSYIVNNLLLLVKETFTVSGKKQSHLDYLLLQSS